jgi:hypothetical protein
LLELSERASSGQAFSLHDHPLKTFSALFVAIGAGIPSGPLCLLLAFLFWATVVFCIAQCRKSDALYTIRERDC